jgi:hypothetical protein
LVQKFTYFFFDIVTLSFIFVLGGYLVFGNEIDKQQNIIMICDNIIFEKKFDNELKVKKIKLGKG